MKVYTKSRIRAVIVFAILLFASVQNSKANIQTWTGANSTDWSDAGNWSGGVPSSADTVLIPGLLSFYPVLSSASFAKSIDMTLGSSLTTNNYALTVIDSITGHGIMTANSSALYIGGNLNLNTFTGNSSNDTIGGHFAVYGTLTANSAFIYVVGNMGVGGTFTGGTATVTVLQNFGVGTAFTGGSSTIVVKKSFIIGTTFTGGVSNVKIAGDFYIGSTFTGGGSIFTFNGTTAQTIYSGGTSITFAILYISNPLATVKTKTNITASNITVRDSSEFIAWDSVTVGGPLVDSGTIQVMAINNLDDLAAQYTGILTLTAGTVKFKGSTAQTLGLASMKNLTINNTIAGVTLSGLVTVSNTLSLLTGGIILDAYKLTITSQGNITGYNSSKFVKTNGTGVLEMLASQTGTIFPIGDAYNPITIMPTTDAVFDASVANGITDSAGFTRTAHAVNVTWNVLLTAGSQSVSVIPQWNQTDELPNFDRSVSFVEKRKSLTANVSDAIWTSTSAPGPASGSDPYARNSGAISMASGINNYIGVSDSVSTLPVTLLYFNAALVGRGGDLKWATSSEINNNYFKVERSMDGKTWTVIGTRGGHGNSQKTENYSYYDNLETINQSAAIYYRLKQVDFNGVFTYSEIRAVTLSPSAVLLTAYPNPASDFVDVSWTNDINQMAIINLVNISGKVVYSAQTSGKGLMQAHINMTGHPTGTYILQMVTNSVTHSVIILKN